MLEEAVVRRIHIQGVDVQRATQTEYPLSVLWHVNHIRINGGAPMAHIWGRSGDLMELVIFQSDEAHLTGLRRQFPKGKIPSAPAPFPGDQDFF